jgi:hypothetical protein
MAPKNGPHLLLPSTHDSTTRMGRRRYLLRARRPLLRQKQAPQLPGPLARRSQPRKRARRQTDPAQGLRQTRAVVQDRLKTLHHDLDSGVKARPNYTVRRAAEDWLREGLDGRSPKTVKKNENVLAPILTAIGARRLRELTAADVHQALATMAARYSTAAVAMGHNALTRAIRHAEARDLVGRNSPPSSIPPKARPGDPARA